GAGAEHRLARTGRQPGTEPAGATRTRGPEEWSGVRPGEHGLTRGAANDGATDLSPLRDDEAAMEGQRWPGRQPGWPDVLLSGLRGQHGLHLPLAGAWRRGGHSRFA